MMGSTINRIAACYQEYVQLYLIHFLWIIRFISFRQQGGGRGGE